MNNNKELFFCTDRATKLFSNTEQWSILSQKPPTSHTCSSSFSFIQKNFYDTSHLRPWMMSRGLLNLSSMFISFIWQFGHFHVISHIRERMNECYMEQKERKRRRKKREKLCFLLNHIALVLINSIQFMKHCRKRDRNL